MIPKSTQEKSIRHKIVTLPNLLTVTRILMIPVIIGLLFSSEPRLVWYSLGLYSVAAITDFFDGYLARTMNWGSVFGQFLDPIADKVFVVAMLIAIVILGRLKDLWLVAAIVILAREALIAVMWAFWDQQNIKLSITKLAKWATTLQMIALGFLLIGDFGYPYVPHALIIGQVGISIAAGLALITGWTYMKAGLRSVKEMDT